MFTIYITPNRQTSMVTIDSLLGFDINSTYKPWNGESQHDWSNNDNIRHYTTIITIARIENTGTIIKSTEIVITGPKKGDKKKQIKKEHISSIVGEMKADFFRFNSKHLIKSILVCNAISMWERFFIFAVSPHSRTYNCVCVVHSA